MRLRGNSFAAAAFVAAVIIGLHLAWITFEFGGSFATKAFSDLVSLPVCALAAIACVRVGLRTRGSGRAGWFMLGGAAASWGIGSAFWCYYELIRHRDVPFPSWADAGFLGMIPLAVGAMVVFSSARGPIPVARTMIQGALIAGCVLFVSWIVVLGDALRSGSGTVLEQAIAVAYPIGDVALISLVLFAVPRIPRHHRMPLVLVGIGLGFIAVSDSGFTLLTQNDTYASGNPIDAGWTAGFLMIWLAAVRALERPVRAAAIDDGLRRAPLFVAYGAVAAAMLTSALHQIFVGNLEPFEFWVALTIVALLLTHQLLVSVENLGLNKDLEAKVAARTEALHAALAKVEETNRVQNAFVASVSHELRTPLTNLLGAAVTLLRPELGLSGDAALLVRASHRNAQRMHGLVEDLLLVAGLARDVAVDIYPFNVTRELQAVIDGSASSDRIELHAAPSVIAAGEPERFRVALAHVIGNAIKFAPSGPVTVIAKETKQEVVVTVTDQGPGIPPDRREQIFDRFVQADDSTTREHEGAGLGLYIARRALEGMGGSIRLSDVGRGASFTISLPRAQDYSTTLRLPREEARTAG